MSEELNFTINVAPKPVAGVTTIPVPEKLAAGLAGVVPQILKDKDHEITLTGDNARDAAMLAAHAKRWGLEQKPQLYITKLPNGKRYPDTVARLSVKLMSEVPPENRPGRKSN